MARYRELAAGSAVIEDATLSVWHRSDVIISHRIAEWLAQLTAGPSYIKIKHKLTTELRDLLGCDVKRSLKKAIGGLRTTGQLL